MPFFGLYEGCMNRPIPALASAGAGWRLGSRIDTMERIQYARWNENDIKGGFIGISGVCDNG